MKTISHCLAVLLLAVAYTTVAAPANSSSSPTISVVKLSFDTLKKWTYVEGKTPIPDFIKKLDGQYVEMIGYMMAPDAAENISDFVLVPALWGCCYGQPLAVNHIVLVKMAGSTRTKYFENTIRVRGRINVGEERIDGALISLYRLDADEVTPK